MPSVTRSQLRGSGSTSQQAAGNEEEMRTAAMQAAMMDDLGIARVAELPLDDGHGDRNRHNRGPGANRNRPAPLPTPSASLRSRQIGNAGPAGSGVGDLWRQAYESGAFDDEDAAAVRGLDDLGGGRIYERVISQTMQILNSHNRRRSNRQSAEQSTVNRRSHPIELPRRIGHINIQSRHQDTNGARAPAGRASVPSGSSRPPLRELNPLARPTRVPPQPTPTVRPPAPAPPPAPAHRPAPASRAAPARPSLAPASNPMIPAGPVAGPSSGAVVPNSNAPLPFEKPFVVLNVVYQRSIRISSQDLKQPVSAIVLLSAAGPPANGSFTVVIYNRRFCQWPISAWYDYTSGPDVLLDVIFKDDNGAMHGYELHFDERDDLLSFMAFVARLRKGEISPPVGHAYASHGSATLPSQPAFAVLPAAPLQHTPAAPLQPTPAAPPPAPAINATSSQTAATDPSNSSVGTQPGHEPEQPQARLPSERTTRGPMSESNQLGTQASPFANNSNTVPAVSAATTRSTVGSVLGDSLAENEAEDANLVGHQSPTASSGNGTVDATSLAGMSPEGVSVTVRGLFKYFLSNTNLAATWTAEKKKEMASAVRAGVLDHISQEARSQGLGGQQVYDIEQLLDGILAPLIQDGQDEPDHQDEPDYQNGASQIRYAIEELISMRPRAVSPPAFLADIPYLPKPGKRRASSSSQSQVHRPVDPMEAQSQVQRAVDAMAWVVGAECPCPPPPDPVQGETVIPTLVDIEETPRVEPEEAMVPGPSVTRPGGTRVTGLSGSRWASGESQIRYANHFPGPAYENVRPGRGHINDLAQLEPRAQVTGSSADLIGLDFRTSDTDMAGAGLENSQAAVDHISQPPALTNDTHTTTDKIENLGLSMSRLTIRSPTKAKAQLVTTSVAQSSDRVSVPSLGPVTPTALRPAAPVFAPSPILLPSVSPAPALAPYLPSAAVAAAAAPIQPSPAQPSASPATQTRPRGLLASRHAAGSGPSSSGNFNFHLPGAARK